MVPKALTFLFFLVFVNPDTPSMLYIPLSLTDTETPACFSENNSSSLSNAVLLNGSKGCDCLFTFSRISCVNPLRSVCSQTLAPHYCRWGTSSFVWMSCCISDCTSAIQFIHTVFIYASRAAGSISVFYWDAMIYSAEVILRWYLSGQYFPVKLLFAS